MFVRHHSILGIKVMFFNIAHNSSVYLNDVILNKLQDSLKKVYFSNIFRIYNDKL